MLQKSVVFSSLGGLIMHDVTHISVMVEVELSWLPRRREVRKFPHRLPTKASIEIFAKNARFNKLGNSRAFKCTGLPTLDLGPHCRDVHSARILSAIRDC